MVIEHALTGPLEMMASFRSEGGYQQILLTKVAKKLHTFGITVT